MRELIARKLDEHAWESAERFGLPPGPQCQVLQESSGPGEPMIVIARMPPGFVEARHVHADIDHWGFIIDGEMHTDSGVLRRGDFLYAPAGVEHGPFSYPVGCTIAGSVSGSNFHHEFVEPR